MKLFSPRATPGRIARAVMENTNAGSNADRNVYFGEMSIADIP